MLRVLNSEHRLPGEPLSRTSPRKGDAETVSTASPDQCKRLDLYAGLSWLPKNVDLARDPMKHDVVADADSETPEDLSIRQQGRLRHKKALLAKLQRGEPGPDSPETTATPSGEPELKKVKQGHPDDVDEMGDNC